MCSFRSKYYIQILFILTLRFRITSGAECPQPSSDRTEAELGGTIKLELHNWKDELQNLILYHINESTGKTVTVLTANDDGVPRPYNGYTNRVALDMPAFGIVSILISDAQLTDSGTYVVVVQSYKRHKSCYEVFILGVPTTPTITQIVGGPDTEGSTFIKISCSSTSTTVPNTHPWKLRYFFRVNGVEVSTVADSQSRFMVHENVLMIAGITKESTLNITCTVMEENSRPRNASSTVVFASYSCHSCHQAQLGKNTGLTVQSPLFGWLVAVSLLISGVGWCIARR